MKSSEIKAQTSVFFVTGKKNASPEPEGKFVSQVAGRLGLAMAVMIVPPVMGFVVPPGKKGQALTEMVVGKLSEVPENTGKIFAFHDQKVIVINDNQKLSACNATCTHLGCLVQWKDDINQIFCACHGARYDQSGEKISGPQPSSLQEYAVRVDDEQIVVSIK